jgi:hypothetical protein
VTEKKKKKSGVQNPLKKTEKNKLMWRLRKNKMKKTVIIFGVILFASFILSSCGGGNSNEPETTIKEPAAANEDCMASTQAELEVCLKDKPIADLATFYCKWSKIEADSKDQNDKQKRKEADNHTDAIQKIVAGRNASDKDKFKELTIGCEEHN